MTKNKYPTPSDKELVQKVAKVLVDKYPTIEKISFFGSRARGDAHKDSDYDILVIQPNTEKSYIVSAEMMDYLLEKGFYQDIQILARTPEAYASDRVLKKSIEPEEVLLYVRNQNWLD